MEQGQMLGDISRLLTANTVIGFNTYGRAVRHHAYEPDLHRHRLRFGARAVAEILDGG